MIQGIKAVAMLGSSFTKEPREIILTGIAGGEYCDLIEVAKIEQAQGTVLEYIYFPDFSKKAVIEKLRTA